MKVKVLNENQVLSLFGVTKEKLDEFRQKRGLPFLSLTSRDRLYFEHDIMDWLETRRTFLSRTTSSGVFTDSK